MNATLLETTLFLIWSLEHEAWWAPDARGYVNMTEKAGRYTLSEAMAICKHANITEVQEAMVPVPSCIYSPMAFGPGKYDEELSVACESAGALNAVLIIADGNKGAGFSCKCTLEMLARLPEVLENVAKQLRADRGW